MKGEGQRPINAVSMKLDLLSLMSKTYLVVLYCEVLTLLALFVRDLHEEAANQCLTDIDV